LNQFKGELRIPREKGGKWVGTDKDVMSAFICSRWLHHVKAKEINLPKKAFIRRVHFSEDGLRMASASRKLFRFFEQGRRITDTTTEADRCYKEDKSKCVTLMVLPSMTREGAMAQLEPTRNSANRIRTREEEATYQSALSGIGGSVGNSSSELGMLAALVGSSPTHVQSGVKALIIADATGREHREQEHQQQRRNDQMLNQIEHEHIQVQYSYT
jgi:hypothetical protein